jgi:hypothetical protein
MTNYLRKLARNDSREMPFQHYTLFNADAVKVDDEYLLFALVEEVKGV